MSRNDALLRLYERLVTKRDAIRGKLDFGSDYAAPDVGDSADAACDDIAHEMDSQLAAIGSRELHHIELAIKKLREGHYGICEGCEIQIPVNRLQALPFALVCVTCQRDEELGLGRNSDALDWTSAHDSEARLNDEDKLRADDVKRTM